MNEEKEMTQHESLSIIQQMLNQAKNEQKDDGLGWITWGWLLFAASASTILNLHYKWFDTFFFWNLFGIAAILLLIVSFIRKLFRTKKGGVKTYTSELYKKLNAGFFISLWFIIMAINIYSRRIDSPDEQHQNWLIVVNMGYAILLSLYAFWILIYGSAMNFKPSIIGAYITWAIGFATMFVKTFEQVMILHGLAVLCGYIIPGHIANNEFKKLRSKG